MRQHFRQGIPWSCNSMDERMDALEAERDRLKRDMEIMDAEILRLKAEVESYKSGQVAKCFCLAPTSYVATMCRGCHCRIDYDWEINSLLELKQDRDAWKAKAEKMREALRKISNSHHGFTSEAIDEHHPDCTACNAKAALEEVENE